MSMAFLMKKLVESNLGYVAISGYDTVLDKKANTWDRTLALLVPRDVKKSLITYLQAVPARKARDNYEYLVSSGNAGVNAATQIKVHLFEKGRGLFPERFESELMMNRVIKGEMIHVPDKEREFWMTLYVMVIHQGKLEPMERRIVIDQLRGRMGIIRAGYKGFPYYPDPYVPAISVPNQTPV